MKSTFGLLSRFVVSAIALALLAMPMGIAQDRVTTFGIQLKPMVPLSLAGTGPVTETTNGLEYRMEQEIGYNFGMVIRRGFGKYFAAESGISFTQRNYTASVLNLQTGHNPSSTFRSIGYEIPTQGLVYIKLADRIYMNTAFGFSIDMYPSNVGTVDSLFEQVTVRQSWLQLSLLANVGWEYRTDKSGYFYFGASYHRPFSPTFTSRLEYGPESAFREQEFLKLSGNYLTFDLRYFFHEDPERRVKRQKKLKKSERSLWNQ